VEGNRWMIQCKREKKLGPTRIKAIIMDAVQASDPPNGYILAAPVNFSKKAYDAFRTALSKRVSRSSTCSGVRWTCSQIHLALIVAAKLRRSSRRASW
jgi:hypothetical protein